MTAKTGAYDVAPGTELWSIVGGEEDPGTPGTLLPGSETCKSALKVDLDKVEQVEVREGDTYTVCDAAGDPVDTTIMQVHLSLKSTNKPDFTFLSVAPPSEVSLQPSACNVCSDALDGLTMAVAYHGR